MTAALIIRPLPGAPRNGVPWKPYRYQGTGEDTLTPELGDAFDDHGRALAPCGTDAAVRRHHRRKEPLDFECRVANAARAARQRARKREAS